jgi:hypothetical protein
MGDLRHRLDHAVPPATSEPDIRGIEQRAGTLRRRRRATPALLVAVVVVVGAPVLVRTRGGEEPIVTAGSTTSTSTRRAVAPSSRLAVISADGLELLDASDGHVVRSFGTDRYGLASVGVASGGPNAVLVGLSRLACSPSVTRVDLQSGARNEVSVVSTLLPATTGDGRRLGYVQAAAGCGTTTVVARDMSSGTETSFDLTSVLGTSDQARITALSWLPDGRRLAVANTTSPTGIALLDTAHPIGPSNPVMLGDPAIGGYSSPAPLADGRIAALRPACTTALDCVADLGVRVVALDPAGSRSEEDLWHVDAGQDLVGLTSDPAGTRLAVRSQGDLLEIADGTSRKLATGIRSAAWVTDG